MAISWELLNQRIPDTKCRRLISEQEAADSGNLTQAVQRFTTDGVTLVTGAGVSLDAGVPSWNSLLARLRMRTMPAQLSGHAQQIVGHLLGRIAYGDSPLVAARQISVAMSDSDLRTAVRDALYEDTDSDPSALLDAVVKLCVKNPDRVGVRAVLTYNFDVLLEAALQAHGVNAMTVYRSARVGNGGMEVRHVHGFLGRKPIEGEGIVLTEAQYHAEYAQPYSWSNVAQLNTFRETSCLFIGSSMTDPNQRRLLETARREQEREHFAVLRRTSYDDVRQELSLGWVSRGRGLGKPSKAEEKKVDERCKLLARLLDGSRAQGLAQLGVRVLWVERYEDVPAILSKLRGA